MTMPNRRTRSSSSSSRRRPVGNVFAGLSLLLWFLLLSVCPNVHSFHAPAISSCTGGSSSSSSRGPVVLVSVHRGLAPGTNSRRFFFAPVPAASQRSTTRPNRRRRRSHQLQAINGDTSTSFSSSLSSSSSSSINKDILAHDDKLQKNMGDQTQQVNQETADQSKSSKHKKQSDDDDSLKNMLKFALPALGIYLANPLLSNIDNAFVGQTAGVTGLAALSPATICTDQMLYMFSFLSRATTGLVSRAYGVATTSGSNPSQEEEEEGGNTQAARQAASAPLTMALACGVGLSVFYAMYTPNMLAALQVQEAIRPMAAAYIYWRGAIAWAALAQAVALSTLMATRDAVTPLKIIALAAGLNVVGDAALCVWPLQWGCSGAAAATAAATLTSCGFMLRGLRRKELLPEVRLPSRPELRGLLEFTGPLFLITCTRLFGFISMQRRAMSLGVNQLAAYQLGSNMMLFFVLFAEPLSQLFQTKLPALIDIGDRESVVSTVKSVAKLAAITSVSVAALAGLALYFGAPFFTADVAVQGLARQVALPLFGAVFCTIMGIAIDGAMLASRDFGFILSVGIATFLTQLTLLQKCHSLPAIFGTFTLRLGSYFGLATLRLCMGHGALGRLLRPKKGQSQGTDDAPDTVTAPVTA